MRPTFRLGRIAGIEVGIHWSLLVIGVLLVGSLAGGQFPGIAPHAHGSYLAAAVLAVVLFFASILAHELAHSIVARRQGQHVDGITLWLLGGVSKLGSEPRNARDEFRVAIAGPATTLALAAIFGLLALTFDAVVAPGTLLPTVAAWLAVVNLILGVFNLLPGAPLDGGRVLTAILWMRNGDHRRSQISAGKRRPGARRRCSSPAHSRCCSPATTSSSPRSSASSCSARPARKRAPRACCARSTTARSARSCGRSPSPPPTGPPWPPSARTPSRRCFSGGTAPHRAAPPGAVFAVPPEAREHVQLRALGVPLAQLPRCAGSRRATDVAAAGLPAIVADADGKVIGVFGLDELKIAANADPVLARSAR